MFMKYDRDPKTDLGLGPTSMKLAEGGGNRLQKEWETVYHLISKIF